MNTTDGFFVVGQRYRNRKGAYEVLDVGPAGIRIKYDDGRVQDIPDVEMQKRIVQNLASETERLVPYEMSDRRSATFYRTLGTLARRGRIEAIVPEKAQQGFERHYQEVKGEIPQPGQNMYYLHNDPQVDKWGCELRISFEATPAELRAMDCGPNVAIVEGPGENEHRINNNGFIWNLLGLGFRLGAAQDLAAIRLKVPQAYLADFEQGIGEIR